MSIDQIKHQLEHKAYDLGNARFRRLLSLLRARVTYGEYAAFLESI